jgi:hypothetical protein
MDPASHLVLIFLMIVGRLEIFTVLLLFHPGLWVRSGSRRAASPAPRNAREVRKLPARLLLPAPDSRAERRRAPRFIGVLVFLMVAYTIIFHFIALAEGQNHSWLSGCTGRWSP